MLNYYKQAPVDIIVTDASDDLYEQRGDYPWAEWIHYPAKDILFYEMWVDLLENKVKTPFICWNNDDDFTTVKFLLGASDFLTDNPDYSMALGEHVQLGNEGYGKFEHLREEEEHDNPIERLEYYFKYLFASPHGVVKKEVFLTACKIILQSLKDPQTSLAPIRFWDKIVNYVAAVLGNKKTIDCVGSIRSHRHHSPFGIRATGAVLLNSSPKELEGDTPYKEIINRISKVDYLSEFLASEAGVSLDDARRATKDAFSMTLEYSTKVSREKELLLPRNSISGQTEINKCLLYIQRYQP